MAANTSGLVEHLLLRSALVGTNFLLVVLLFLGLGHADEPIEGEGGEDVEDDIDPEDTEVLPDIIVVGGQLSKENIGALDGAESTTAGGLGVLQVAASWRNTGGSVDVIRHKLTTSLALWGFEVDEFVCSTLHCTSR